MSPSSKYFPWLIAAILTAALLTAALVIGLGDNGDNEGSKTSTFKATGPGSPGYVPPNSLSLTPGRIVQNVPEQGTELPPVRLTNTTTSTLRVALDFIPYTKTTNQGIPRFEVDKDSIAAGRDVVRLGAYRFEIAPNQVKTIEGEIIGEPPNGKTESFGVIVADVDLPGSSAKAPADIGGQSQTVTVDPVLRLLARTWIQYQTDTRSSFTVGKPYLEQSTEGLIPKVDITARGLSSVEPLGEFILYQGGEQVERVSFSAGEIIPAGQRGQAVSERILEPLDPGSYTLVVQANPGQGLRSSKTSFRIGADGLVAGSGQKLPRFGAVLSTRIEKRPQAGIPTPMRVAVKNTGRTAFAPKISITIDSESDLRNPIRDSFRLTRVRAGQSIALSNTLESVPAGRYLVSTEVRGPGGIVLDRKSEDLKIPRQDSAPSPEKGSWVPEDPLLLMVAGVLAAAMLSLALVGALSLFFRARSAFRQGPEPPQAVQNKPRQQQRLPRTQRFGSRRPKTRGNRRRKRRRPKR